MPWKGRGKLTVARWKKRCQCHGESEPQAEKMEPRNVIGYMCQKCQRTFTGMGSESGTVNGSARKLAAQTGGGSDIVKAHKSALSHVQRSDRCKGSGISRVILTFGTSDAMVGGAGSAQPPRIGAPRAQRGNWVYSVLITLLLHWRFYNENVLHWFPNTIIPPLFDVNHLE